MAGVQKRPSVAASVWLTLFCVTAILGGSALLSEPPTPPPPPDGREHVAELRIVGNDFFPTEKIARYIHTRAGRPYDPDVVEEDVRRLMHTRMFTSVDPPTTQRVAGGLAVTFRVHERKVLKHVKFVGCEQIKRGTLEKEVALKEGDPFDPYAVKEGQRKLVDYYRSKGFPKVYITIVEGEREGDSGVVYYIDEGPKVRYGWTGFVGTTFASDAHLRTLIQSKPGVFWVFGGDVDPKQIEEDRIHLEAYYHSMGFHNATVGRYAEYSESGNWLFLTYCINEGPRFMVRDVKVLGNFKFSKEQLTKDMKLAPGKFFNQNEMLADQTRMQNIYGADGYVFADTKGDVRFLPDQPALDVVYRIVEGGRYRVGEIKVKIAGEYPHTRLTTVLNRLSVRPGDILDVRELRDSERRLKASQLFALDPARNVSPKLSFKRPTGERREDESELADQPRSRGTYRGQSPSPQRYEANRPADWGGSPQPPVYDVDVEIEGQWDPNYRWQDEEPRESTVRGQSPDDRTDAAAGPRDVTWRNGALVPVSDGAAEPQPAAPEGEASPGRSNLRWLPRDRAVYRGQSGVYDPNEGYPAPASNGSAPGGPGSLAPPSAPGLQAPLPPGTSAAGPPPAGSYPGSYPAGSNPAPAYPPGGYQQGGYQQGAYQQGGYQQGGYQSGPCPPGTTPVGPYVQGPYAPAAASPIQSPPPYPSRPEGQYAPQGPLPSSRPSINDALPLLGTLPNEEPLLPLPLITEGLEETTTGRLMFSVGVNSDLGVLGSITLDEQNFDPTRWPHSWDEFVNGQAFRGDGKRLRIEAAPGTQLQRYTVSYTDPYLLDNPNSLGLSAYYFERIFTEWTESHGGGRIMIGRQLIPDLSASFAYRGEDVRISNPIIPPTAVPGIPALNEVLGSNSLHGLSFRLTHDTRDNQFLATEGYLLDMGVEEVLGSFQYPRGDVDLRKYFLLHQHPDGSGRHVLSLSGRMAITGSDTPIYDNYFIGGFTTLRGFAFREASPRDPVYDVTVGGQFSMLTSAEYMFPITADDTLRGVFFCDSGVVQPSINHWHERYRASLGFGLRITIPAMGPAPIALDFAFPVSQDPHDQTQVFSFFIGFLR